MNCLCRPSRIMSVRINLLDETEFIHEIKDDLPGQALLDVVFARLNLIETSYFGIRYIDEENQTHWLDPASRISRQLKPKSDPYDLYFGVKFYAADPCKLLEEITRYQLFLQVKQDVLQGRLPVAFELAAELGAFVVQSELGDYDQRRHSKGYVSEFRLLPNQSSELETRVSELHQQLKGMSPSSAELNYLDKVKWHDMYGVDLHPVLGEDSVEYFLGLTPSGIVVLRNKTTVAHYYWPRIAKVYYKGRYFMLRISDKNNELSTYGFETPRKSACKHLWRCCVEHHAFFRQVRVAPLPSSQSHATDLFQLGSRFRHSRPDKQTEKDELAAGRSPPAFTRTPSKRQPRRVIDDFFNSNGNGNGNGTISTNGNGSGAAGGPGGVHMGNRPLPQPGLGTISKHKHRHRRTSDNESELSRGSGRSGRSGRSHHRKHRRSHRHRRDSAGGSDHDSNRGRSYSGHRSSSMRSGSAELIDSTSQWREVQRRQAEASLGQSSVQQAAVSKSSMVARSLHSNDSHSDTHSHHKSRRHRKNKSPSESRSRMWNSELAKHLQFDLVDTEGMSEQQLREIPYTVVETNSKRSNSNLKIHKSNSKSSVGAKSTGSGNTITNGSGSGNAGQARNRVDRIRGLYYQSSHPHDSNGVGVGNGGHAPKNGSIRSASTISSRECERNNGLVRMMSSMSMGDFISPTGSNLSPLENSALRVSHEHTDSGLGADQDYAYSSERSSDSTRYGTNKSSGASSGSHRKSGGSAGGGNSGGYNSLMQQTVSNQQQQQRSLFAQQQRQQQQKSNYKYATSSPSNTNPASGSNSGLAPVHNPSSASPNPNPNANSNPNPNTGANGNATNPTASPANRLLHYTTFENNQYKFSLNNALVRNSKGVSGGSSSNIPGGGASGGGGAFSRQRSFVEWPSNPAAPYYYQGPSTHVAQAKRRDAKSDIGVPTRRLSGQSITKTQLLTGGHSQLANAGCYPLHYASSSVTGSAYNRPPGQRSGGGGGGMAGGGGPSGGFGLQPAKSDLFLSYIHGGEYERPYIYNYKMPQMPAGGGGSGGSPKQQPTAYHISGSQTADPPPPPPPLYGGTAPANDVMYYQFDKGAAPSTSAPPPIVQQPRQSSAGGCGGGGGGGGGGPLVYLQHGQNASVSGGSSSVGAVQPTTHSSHSCSEEDEAMIVLEAMQQDAQTTNDETEDTDDEAAEAEDMFDADAPLMSPTGSHNSANNNSNSNNNTNCNSNSISNCININNNGNGNNGNRHSTATNINFDNCNANVYSGQQAKQLGPITTGSQTLNCPTLNANTNTKSNSSHTTSNSHTNAITTTNANANAIPTCDPPTNVAALTNNHTTNSNITTAAAAAAATATATAAAAAIAATTGTTTNANATATAASIATNLHSNLQQNQNISSSLEIILSPIIQSSRRAQFQSPPPPTTTPMQ
ncbi:uncharacterized protein Dana_GF17780, isoform C [Drosophila ananassae]|uniref:Erythrocyte membrane protein band 4.1-like 4A n=1 Tax=Drosophila ananassae TaxID=7217 RepID=A0A0P8YDG8_DROAN|nr:hornerin isoform X4 [Drosophila ananassae]KPU79534.1 uncharacterized protein Dana_GF17780, isoform C [Drosophila ananassae]